MRWECFVWVENAVGSVREREEERESEWGIEQRWSGIYHSNLIYGPLFLRRYYIFYINKLQIVWICSSSSSPFMRCVCRFFPLLFLADGNWEVCFSILCGNQINGNTKDRDTRSTECFFFIPFALSMIISNNARYDNDVQHSSRSRIRRSNNARLRIINGKQRCIDFNKLACSFVIRFRGNMVTKAKPKKKKQQQIRSIQNEEERFANRGRGIDVGIPIWWFVSIEFIMPIAVQCLRIPQPRPNAF